MTEKMMVCRSLILVFLAKYAYSRYFIVGPAQANIASITDCPEPEYKNLPTKVNMKTRMYNDTTQIVYGTIILPTDMNENVTITIKSWKLEKNVRKVAFNFENAEACTTMTKYVGELWMDVERQLGIEPGVCPVKAGNYSVDNMVIDLTIMKIQMFYEGRFETRLILKNGTNPIYCGVVDITLTPKKQ